MSNATMKEKIALQARQLNNLQAELNYIIQELYKSNPTHELFVKSPEMAEQVKKAVELEATLQKTEQK
jgi:hypothetical protein